MAKHFHGTRTEERALDLYVKLVRAADTVDAGVMAPLASADLSPSQFGVLEALYHVGPMCLTELARKLLKTGGNLTMVARNLEKRGLVTRVRQVGDRRYSTIFITAKGRSLIQRLFPAHVARIVRQVSGLSASEQETLASLCKKLGLSVSK
ncbi:MAG: MarR family winged helix-turn-helix transcriptional regulator [Terriglobales bacterium]